MNISDDMKRILEGYTKGRYGFICTYAQRIVDKDEALKSDTLKYRISPEDDKEQKIRDTEMLLQAICSQPLEYQELYRIERTTWYDKAGGYKEGDILTWGIRSTSRDPSFVDRVVDGHDDGMEFDDSYGNPMDYISYRIKGKVRSLDISPYSRFNQSESLVSGCFRVESVKVHDYFGTWKKREEDIDSRVSAYMKDPISAFDELGIKYRRFISKAGNDMIDIGESVIKFESISSHWKVKKLLEEKLGKCPYFCGRKRIIEIELSSMES